VLCIGNLGDRSSKQEANDAEEVGTGLRDRRPARGRRPGHRGPARIAEVIVSVKPPSGQWEAKPPAAEGWVWRSGFYDWEGERFVWKKGEWILDQEGKDFRQYEWVESGEGKWKLEGGDWVAEKHS
jgi:hypothetical protein